MTTVQRGPATRSALKMTLLLAAALGMGASLAACGPATTEPVATTVASSPSAPEPSPTEDTAPSSPESETPASTPSATTAPLCTAASLAGSLDASGGGAAGHVYMQLIVKNTSTGPCILDGYPGVSMVKAGSTSPIGAPAERDPAAPSSGPISLAPGQSAAAVLRYTQADNYQNCQRVKADSILVYPPSATDSLAIPHPLTACSNDDIKLLTIGAFQP